MVRKNNRSSSLEIKCSIYIYPLVFPRGQTYAFAAEKVVNHNSRSYFLICLAPCKAIQHSLRFYRDSGYSGFHSISVYHQYSGFQSLEGFRIIRAAFHKPNFPDSGIRIPLHVMILLKMFPCFLAVTFVSQKT